MKTILHIKKYIAAAFLLVLLGTVLAPVQSVFASDQVLWDSYTMPSTRQKERLYDQAELLFNFEQKDILDRLNALSQKHNSNIVILTCDNHSGPIQDYADDYFDYNGFQADYNGNGILFMLSMYDREFAFSTSGNATEAFTDYGLEHLFEEMRSDLSDDDYYGAFKKYIETVDYLYTQYENGNTYDVGFKDTSPQALIKVGVICVGIGLVVALIPLAVMAASLNNVEERADAAGYQSHNGLHMSVHKDTYLRSRTTKTRIPDSSSSSRSSGGGSSIHISSSGSSHGGSHGHF